VSRIIIQMKPEYSSLILRFLLVVMILFLLRPAVIDSRIPDALKKANYLMMNGRLEEAETQLEWVKSIESWQKLPWVDLAQRYIGQKKYDRSINILEPISRDSNLDAAGWLALSKGYEHGGLPSQMEKALLSLIALKEPGEATESGYRMLVKLFRSENQFEEALQYQTELVQFAPDKHEYLFDKVLLMLSLDVDSGLKEWVSVTGKPDWLAQVGSQINAADLETNEPVRVVKIGRAFGGINQWDLAEFWLQKAVNLSPEYAEAWAFLAEARQQRGLSGKDQITRALELASDSPGVRALAALYFRRQMEFPRAIALLQKNINDQPSESTWYLEIASILGETGKMENAVLMYQKAIELAPLDYSKQTALARFCIQYEYQINDLGLPAAKKAVELAVNSPEAQDINGQTLSALGHTEDANRAYSVALSLNPDYAPTWLHIGQASISSGDFKLAKEALQKAVSISGISMEGQIARRLLEQYNLTTIDAIGN
jgi:tetratricopeptide (TPR) repeat protein